MQFLYCIDKHLILGQYCEVNFFFYSAKINHIH